MNYTIKAEDLTVIRQRVSTTWTKETVEKVLAGLEAIASVRLPDEKDFETTEVEGRPEILLGDTARAESKEARNRLAFHEFGIFQIGCKTVITGWTPYTARLAAERFVSLLAEHCSAGEDGTYTLDFPDGFALVDVAPNYFGDLPAFAGDVQGVYDCNDDCYAVWYQRASYEDYQVYSRTVREAGYAPVMENAIGANSYATYVKGDRKLHVYYVARSKKLRIVYGPNDVIGELLQGTTPSRGVTPSATLMPMQYVPAPGGGACMIFTLEDGTFFVIDGGWKEEADTLYKTLQALNTDANGADAPIVISAWFISHGHGDHTGCIYTFAPKYGSEVSVNALIYNGVHTTQCCTVRGLSDVALSPERVKTGLLAYLRNEDGNETPVMKLHSGQKLCFGGAEIDVMFTHEDMFDVRIGNFNDFNTVLRLKLGGEIMMLANDANVMALPSMIYEVGEEPLKARFVMVAHHAGDHSYRTYYEVVGAKYYFFPNSYAHFIWHTIDQAKFQPWAEYVRLNATELYLADDWDPEFKTHETCTTVYLPYTEGTYVEWSYLTERPSLGAGDEKTRKKRPVHDD